MRVYSRRRKKSKREEPAKSEGQQLVEQQKSGGLGGSQDHSGTSMWLNMSNEDCEAVRGRKKNKKENEEKEGQEETDIELMGGGRDLAS